MTSEHDTYVYIGRYPTGPFQVSLAREDITKWAFPRYAHLKRAGAIAPATLDNQVRMWHPKTGHVVDPVVGYPYPILPHENGNIYKFIFVVTQVFRVSQNGTPAYQIRINPEHFCPGIISFSERVNHSQLSDGGRFAAILCIKKAMQVYGAGSIYIQNGHIIGIDSNTGHYHTSMGKRGVEMIQAMKIILKKLRYDTSIIQRK